MTKAINVNPDHYKVAGRERQGDAVIQNLERQQFAERQAEADRWRAQHEGLQPWEATAAPSVKDTKSSRRRSAKGGPRRERRTARTRADAKTSRRGDKTRKTRPPAARRSKAARPSRRKRHRNVRRR